MIYSQLEFHSLLGAMFLMQNESPAFFADEDSFRCLRQQTVSFFLGSLPQKNKLLSELCALSVSVVDFKSWLIFEERSQGLPLVEARHLLILWHKEQDNFFPLRA